MHTIMKVFRKALQRGPYAAVAALLFWAGLLAVVPGRAEAYGALSSRSVEMSDTANGATNAAYKVSFTTVTAGQTIGAVVIEFCSNSPILGDSCAIASGFNTNYATLTLTNITGNITGLSVDTTTAAPNGSSSNRLLLKRTPGAVANGPVSITLGNGTTNGISNPANDNTTFYARILTYASSTAGPTTTESADSTDAGGVAMSTASQLNVTAKVQETLTFCVYTLATCADGGKSVTLGDANGVLASTSTTYTGNAYYDVASNAFGGVSVRMRGNTLRSGSFSIDPTVGTCPADATTSGIEQFGVRVSAVGTDQSATSPYDCTTGHHSFDVANVNTLYGQEVGKTVGASDVSTSQLEFAAKSAGTTEAGVYTSTLTLVATATY